MTVFYLKSSIWLQFSVVEPLTEMVYIYILNIRITLIIQEFLELNELPVTELCETLLNGTVHS